MNFNLHARRGLRRRPVRAAGHGRAGDEHARRGHEDARRARRSARSSPRLGADARQRLEPRQSRLVNLSALKPNLDESLDLFADVILNPAFPQADFERLQEAAARGHPAREGAADSDGAARVPAAALRRRATRTAIRSPAAGTEESVAKLTRDDLAKFHQTWFKPNNATLVVVGDTTLAEIKPKLEKLFATGSAATCRRRTSRTVGRRAEAGGLPHRQAGRRAVGDPRRRDRAAASPTRDEIAIETMNTVLGGTFTSRMNMNLREDKHWSYGARHASCRRARPAAVHRLRAGADRQDQGVDGRGDEGADATSRTDRPITADELAMAQEQSHARAAGIVGDERTPSAARSARWCASTSRSTTTTTYAGKVKSHDAERHEPGGDGSRARPTT